MRTASRRARARSHAKRSARVTCGATDVSGARSNAERARDYRRRRGRIIVVYPVELTYAALDCMIDPRWISEADSLDRKKLAKVVGRMVSSLVSKKTDTA